MVEESTLIPLSSSPPSMTSPPPIPKSEKSDHNTPIRKLINRQQSITRGTASSIAKAVRSPPVEKRKLLSKKRQSTMVPRQNPPSPSPSPPPPPQNDGIVLKKRKSIILRKPDASPNNDSSDNNNNKTIANQELIDSPITPDADECLSKRHSSESLNSEFHHHYHHHEEDLSLPGYMRRPICAACNRNVKVTSSSETSTHQKASTSTSSRRSSFSTIKTQNSSETNLPDSNPTIQTSHSSDERSHSPVSPIPTSTTKTDHTDEELEEDEELEDKEIEQVVEEYEEEEEEEEKKDAEEDAEESACSSSSITSCQQMIQQVKLVTEKEHETQIKVVVQQPLNGCSWETKLGYSMTRFKWNLSHLFGNLVGSSMIEEVDFDSLGYPENLLISGICVTNEPELLPKTLQKYFKPCEPVEELICHKYIIQVTREKRLSKFKLLSKQDWVLDELVNQCEFTIKSQGYKTKKCNIEFGFFNRRHHCRRCGHIFCHSHSLNKLPLFINNGQDCGEWARVCDLCFYSLIEPQCISRS